MHLAEHSVCSTKKRKTNTRKKENNYAFNIFSFGRAETLLTTELRSEREQETGDRAQDTGCRSRCRLASRPVLPFFTFNEAQEFQLDNLLSAGQPKGKKPKRSQSAHKITKKLAIKSAPTT